MQLDPDELRTYRQSSYFDEKKSNETSPIAIFFAVLGAILVSWLIREAYVDWQVRKALTIFNQQMAIISEQSQRSMENIQLQSQAYQDAANQRAIIEEEKLHQKKLYELQLERDKKAAIMAEIDMKNKKEKDWIAFYKPIKGCESSNENKDLMKCGNDYAKAKKAFEAQWANTNSSNL